MKLNESIEQLRELLSQPLELQVAVYGKYNHGKSSLLNSLIGKEVFKTADIRETVTIKSYIKDNITWIDTPGLDADVTHKDDDKANKFLNKIDLLLFVHSVNEGELDNKEINFIKRQYQEDKNIILILAQIDKIGTLENIQNKIARQLLFMTIPIKRIAVSSKRASHFNQKVREQSNIKSLIKFIQNQKNGILERRGKKKVILKEKIIKMIEEKIFQLDKEKSTISADINQIIKDFEEDKKDILEYVSM